MSNPALLKDAKAPERRFPLALHLVLAQIAVVLCCLLVWFLCENVVPKEYSDATYRTKVTMVDNNYIPTRYTGLCQRLREQAAPAAPQPDFE